MRVQYKITIMFLIVSLAPLAATGVIAYRKAVGVLRDSLGATFETRAHVRLRSVEHSLHEVALNVQTWSELDLMQQAITGDVDGKISSFLVELNRGYKSFASMSVVNTQGKVVAASNPAWIGRDLKSSVFFEPAMHGEAFMSDVRECVLDDTMSVVFARPIYADFEKGKIIGILVVGWRANNLSQIILPEEEGENDPHYRSNVILMRKDGTVIAAPQSMENIIFNWNLLDLDLRSARLANEGKDGYLMEDAQGMGKVVVGYAHSTNWKEVPNLEWSALVFLDKRSAFSAIDQFKFIAVGLGAIVAFFVFIFSMLASRRLTGSLRKVMEGARKITKGSFDVQVDVKTRDEFGDLAKSFNLMAANLHTTTVSRDYLDNIMGNMTNSLVVLTPAGRIKTVNGATCRMLGYEEEELLDKPFERILAEEEVIKAKGMGSLKEKDVVQNVERRYRTKDGRKIPVIFSSSVMRAENKDVLWRICMAQDITQQKESLAQQARLATAMESVGDGIMITDTDSVIQYVNPAFERLTGYVVDEVVGKKPSILKSGVHEEKFYENLWDTLRRGKVWNGLMINRKKDGTFFEAEQTISIVRDESFRVVNYVSVLRDVTQRRKQEVERARLATALEAVGEAIIIADIDGVIQYVNPAFERITGFAHTDAVGRKPSILKSGIYDKVFYKSLWDTILEGKLWSSVIVNKKKDASLFTAEQTIAPVRNPEGQIVNFVGVLHDITERQMVENEVRKANENLVQEQRAVRALYADLQRAHDDLAERERTLRAMFEDIQRANEDLKHAQRQVVQSEKLASIGQLAAGVAHEINNPLGFISSNLQTLEEYLGRYDKLCAIVENLSQCKDAEKAGGMLSELKKVEDEVALKFIKQDTGNLLKETREGLERIKRIVMDLRSFSREDEGGVEMVNVESIIDSILNIVGNEIKYKADLKKDYGGVPPVKCNSRKIGQVFINLLINAAQAMESRGTIVIKTYADKQYVYVDVKDTAKGMDEATIKKIFEPFFTTKPVGEGTGLGLSISYDIIKEHHGDVIVVSKPGKGTTFTVKLPLDSAGSQKDGSA